MRYFVVFEDGTISTCKFVYFDRSTGITYFSVKDVQYKLDFSRPCVDVHIGRKIPRLTSSSFYTYKSEIDEWYEVNYIKCLLEINEEENEEMNYFQSTDFNAGVIYNKIERAVSENMLRNKWCIKFSDCVTLPIIQIIPKTVDVFNERTVMNATLKAVKEHFDAVYGKNFDLKLPETRTDKQYIHIDYAIIRKEQYKEMTVAEIEKALGYKIKVVGDK